MRKCDRKFGISCGRDIPDGEIAYRYSIHANYGTRCKEILEYRCQECQAKAMEIFAAASHQAGWLKRAGVSGQYEKRLELAEKLGVTDQELLEFDRRARLASPEIRAKFEEMFPL